ncbi:hypothetical protein [Cellulomonas rhizosphaerae]|uniref:hypothetical protein n=1 Tax=Cellulomonas rhizosphaerae TaxID=2293719 RepID=UPI0026A7FD98|nr:hypothetical protein [Cellulomonas rhizosphaerae]
MAKSSGKSGGVKGIGLLTIIFGIIFVVAGAGTWGAVTTNLGAEKITVSDDADYFAGQLVDTPWEAWVQADVIDQHALEIGGGKTYAELPQDDPNRDTVMTASFLRASLFTSVVAFGVALLVVGIGVILLFIGFALRKTGSRLAGIDGQAAAVTNPYPAPDPVVAPAAAAPVAAAAAAPTAPPVAPPQAPPVPPAPEPVAAPDPVVAPVPPAPEPVAAEPVVEKPVVEKPVVEKPVVDEPVAEKPAADDPVAEAPATTPLDGPADDAPASDAPPRTSHRAPTDEPPSSHSI